MFHRYVELPEGTCFETWVHDLFLGDFYGISGNPLDFLQKIHGAPGHRALGYPGATSPQTWLHHGSRKNQKKMFESKMLLDDRYR